jgi:hypothetical protein
VIIAHMPRTARPAQGVYRFHLVNLGNGRRTVFHKDGDHAAFETFSRQAR